jgi:hypothetical protein
MANEIRVTTALQVRKGSTQYLSQPATVQANMLGTRGPTPGALIIATGAGTDISLAELSIPGGWARLMNLEVDVGTGTTSNNYITIGIKSGGNFYPFTWLQPGEETVLRLVPVITGVYHAQAAHAQGQMLIEAFDQ